MNQKIVIDTNVLIDNPYILEDEEKEFIIPFVVIKELDKLKSNINIGYSARVASKIINENRLNNITIDSSGLTQSEINDDIIVNIAKKENAILMTQDLNMMIKAKSIDVDFVNANNVKIIDRDFKGYYNVEMDSVYYYKTFSSLSEFQVPEIEEYIKFENEVPINSYLIITPENEHTNWQIVKKIKEDDIEKYVKIDTSKKILRGLNHKGEISLDEEVFICLDCILSDTPLAVITGRIGSGKTLNTIVGSLLQVAGNKNRKKYDKIYVSRPPVISDKNLEIGFLPGTLEEKQSDFMFGIKHAISYIYKDEELVSDIFNSYFNVLHLGAVQGASFHNSIVIADESQFLSENSMRQIMSRIGNTSKLILIFDEDQTYGVNRGFEGWRKLLPYVKGNELISYVKLQKVRRSPLTELAMEIFK